MAYTKQVWKNLPDKTTPITAERLNHLETQYDKAVANSESALEASSKKASVDVLDSFTQVEVLCNFPFRTSSDPAWVQGFFYDEEGGRVFISRTGASTAQVHIDEYLLDGSPVSKKVFPTSAASYLESLIHWRNEAGDDMFLGEDGMSGLTTIINFTQGVVEKSFQANGRVSWAITGPVAYRSNIQHLDAKVSTVGAVFLYDLDGLKRGEAISLGSMSLESSAPLTFKGQGMAAARGVLCIYGGSASQAPSFSAWTLDGTNLGTIALDRKNFLRVIGDSTPGSGVSETSSWEAEGLQGFGDHFLSGHTIGTGVTFQERFVVVRHGSSRGSQAVAPATPPEQANTPWEVLPGSNPPVWFRHEGGYTTIRTDGAASVPVGEELVIAGVGSLKAKWAPPWNIYGVASVNGGAGVATVGVWLNGSVRIFNKTLGSPISNINGFQVTFPAGRFNTT